jgi:hypothetical protein
MSKALKSFKIFLLVSCLFTYNISNADDITNEASLIANIQINSIWRSVEEDLLPNMFLKI